MNSCTLQEILLFAFLLGIRGENLTYSHVCLSSCACKGIYTRSFQLESLHSQANRFPCFQSSKIQQNAFSKMSNYSLKQMSPESTLNWLQACCFSVVSIFCEEGQTRWISWTQRFKWLWYGYKPRTVLIKTFWLSFDISWSDCSFRPIRWN